MRTLIDMTAAHSPRPSRRASILDRLSSEWEHLAVHADDLEAVRRWGLPGGRIHSLDDVLVRSGYRPARPPATQAARSLPADGEAHDAYLLGLLALARD